QKVRAYKVSSKFVKSVGAEVRSLGFPASEIEKENLKLQAISEAIQATSYTEKTYGIVFSLKEDIKQNYNFHHGKNTLPELMLKNRKTNSMGSAANNPNISSRLLRDTSVSSFRTMHCFEMCRRYVLLPVAGNRNNSNGSLNNVGSNGNYWSSTVSGTNARNLNFNSSNANMNSNNRANGFSVRCLKDCNTMHGSTTALVSFNANFKINVL
ncbi:hypothetical protein Q4Q35_01820, partial [Flavivirga aquimarina]|nr:hypothetical protein [Flavivirga aquimarina]